MQLDALWNRARADLVITAEHGDQDLFLWEHSVRVAENARRVAALPVIQKTSPDDLAVYAAGLYHEAGWIIRFNDGDVRRQEFLIRPLSETYREQGAILLEKSLGKLLPPETVRRASEAVRSLSDREIDSIEGQIVSDADNLDEFGILSLWMTIRRGMVDGKGVQAVIDTWRRRKEYRFWEARLNESFRFAPVRALARRRLEKFERLMKELEEQHQGDDLQSCMTPEQADKSANRSSE